MFEIYYFKGYNADQKVLVGIFSTKDLAEEFVRKYNNPHIDIEEYNIYTNLYVREIPIDNMVFEDQNYLKTGEGCEPFRPQCFMQCG